MISQLKKLDPKSDALNANSEEDNALSDEGKIRKQTAIQNKWNDVLHFLECFKSKKVVDKCMS